MFTNTSIKIADYLENKGVVNSESKEIHLFGINQGLILMLNITTIFVIGVFINALMPLIIFTVAFMPLRSFAGGFHAGTPLKCYILSTATALIVGLLLPVISIHPDVLMAFIVILGCVIMKLAPIGTTNKPLDAVETTVYKKRTRIIFIIEIILAGIFVLFNIPLIALCVFIAFIIVVILLMIEKANNSKLLQ